MGLLNLSGRIAAGVGAAVLVLACAAPAFAWPCRVTDFTDRTIASLNDVQKLSVVTEMTQTEYDRSKTAEPGGDWYYELIAESANIRDAREKAHEKLYGLGIENIDGYRLVWASDFLTDEQLRKFTDCITSRQPGLVALGRPENPSTFHMTISHLTPIGIEKITTKLIASYNIANAAELETFLTDIGPQDHYPAKTFPLKIADPSKRAVVVLRAGWESSRFLYIPPYPTKDYFEQAGTAQR